MQEEVAYKPTYMAFFRCLDALSLHTSYVGEPIWLTHLTLSDQKIKGAVPCLQVSFIKNYEKSCCGCGCSL
jgi:hypothetical protein